LLRARAIETGCFVFAPAQCGTHPRGRKTFGHSLIIDPWGEVIAEAGDEPGVITAEIDLAKVAQVRGQVPSLSNDRNFTGP
jgi:predicted amidohydrolase